jgi:uncharacterized protein (TIGR00725 family)
MVAGGGRCDQATHDVAVEVGREIARAGAVLLCGGGGGVMAAAAEGARSAGGLTVGVLPGKDAVESPPNPAIEIPLFTGLGQARNVVLVLSADAVIAVGGEWGTLSEIATAMKHRRPVVLFDSWQLGHPAGPGTAMPATADTPREAVDLALTLAGLGGGTR